MLDLWTVFLLFFSDEIKSKKFSSQFPQASGIQKDGLPQHSRATSPRRLIKQVALESPPTNASDELSSSAQQHQQTTTFKVVAHEIKSDKPHAKEESYLTQRQRLRKPFAVDSQQLPDSRIKYAGSWAPQSATLDKDESENQDDDNGGNEQYSEQRQVCVLAEKE